MDTRTDARETRRVKALWCAWIALIGISAPLALLLLIRVSVTGAGAMVGVLPIGFVFLTWWVWLTIGVAGLVFSKDAARGTLPAALSIAAIALSFAGFFIAVRMFDT